MPGIVVSAPASGPAVLERLGKRDVDVGVVLADAAYLSYVGQLESGVPPFEQLRAIAVVGRSAIHLVVSKSTHVRSVADLRGLRVGVGGPRSALALAVERLLRAFGLGLGDVHGVAIASTEAAESLAKGKLDAAFIAIDIDPPEAPGLIATKAGGTLVDLEGAEDRKSTRLNSSHLGISYAVFCLKKNRGQNAARCTAAAAPVRARAAPRRLLDETGRSGHGREAGTAPGQRRPVSDPRTDVRTDAA